MIKFLSFKARSLFLVCFLLMSIPAAAQHLHSDGVRKGMIKVRFKPEMTATLSTMSLRSTNGQLTSGITTLDAAARRTKAKSMRRLFPYDAKFEGKLRKHGLHLWYIVDIDESADPTLAAREFSLLREVATAEVEHEKILAPYSVKPYQPGPATLNALPFNDPMLKDQWHYRNTGQAGAGDFDINLFTAWSTTTGSGEIIVSVHDEGVDVKHADLKQNIWVNHAEANGIPNVDDDNNGYVDDVNGYNFQRNTGAIDAQYHGTHVAGTIAAVNNNGIGVAGVAGGDGSGNGVKIMSMQILGGASIERSYVYAANNGAVISQNSWGYSSPGYVDQSILDAIDYFVEEAGDYPGSPMKGGIVIFAAGNSSTDGEWYPGYHPRALSVAALGPEGKRAYYSNFGTWVEVSAPGGDLDYGSKGGVLSTIPKDQYAYMEGTSMACPHVSGVAALALANRTRQMTNDELWNKIVTGVVAIDHLNEEYAGKLGSGAIHAALAISNDAGIAPEKVTDLTITGLAQEFATFEWTVPEDEDDSAPTSFTLYYHTSPFTSASLASASSVMLKNTLPAGSKFSYELDSLIGLTQYYFAVASSDRWGNRSELSDVVDATTNDGPTLTTNAPDEGLVIDIDVSMGVTSGERELTILNQGEGILRWDHLFRHKATSLSYNASAIHYPKTSKTKSGTQANVARRQAIFKGTALRDPGPVPLAFNPIDVSYSSFPTNIIGETDITLTNSAAARFLVTQENGFNLTQVSMYLKHDPAKGPVIVEVYKGAMPSRANLVYAQEHVNWSAEEMMAYITLNEQLFFEAGSTFWVVFHVPSGNLFPLGIGYEDDASYSTNCFMSFDLGTTWAPLEEVLNSKDFAWTITASSYNEHLGNYLTLSPGSGDVAGHDQTGTIVSADATALINGTYSANLILRSNDAATREMRVPVTLNVMGHKPDIRHIHIADYGSVFVGTSKTIDLVLDNQGFGNFNDPVFTIEGAGFEIEGSTPWQIKAREEAVISVSFHPLAPGNTNGKLIISNGEQTYEVPLFGVGAETARIAISPENQLVDEVAIGDVVNARITVSNEGAYPLKYFIPGFDTKGISENWPASYHNYGYKFRTNLAGEAEPLEYAFHDISSTGIDITEPLKDGFAYVTVDMGFQFPFYGDKVETLYVAQKGFTTFDNSIRPVNVPSLSNMYNPRGYISPLGTYLSLVEKGSIFYKVEADRVIVQYNDVWNGTPGQSMTVQMVLFANGDIRFYYDVMDIDMESQTYLTILIENLDQDDGIMIHSYDNPIELSSGLVLGFDYPGPAIITNVTNGSGIIAPGASADVDLELSTQSLAEGLVKRYVNFISNDPATGQKSALVELAITSGGTPQPVVSVDTIAFGETFQGALRSSTFIIQNPGTANVSITGMTFANNQFTLNGELPSTVKPGLYGQFTVHIPTATLGPLEDWLSINYADGTHDTIYVSGVVVESPAFESDLSLLEETLAYGEKSAHPLTITNTGAGPMEVVVTGTQWMTFDLVAEPSSNEIPDNTYTYRQYNNGDFYQWIEIRETGTQLPFWDFNLGKESYWRTISLPFPVSHYGELFYEMKIGDNGIISFEEDPEVMFFPANIPQTQEGRFIMPYWTFSGFDTMFRPEDEVGIFYQFFDDKIVITWSTFVNNFGGMGDPVSAQVIFYKNGTMKFQYRVEEGGNDLTTSFSTIGIQESSSNGVSISDHNHVAHGAGLAFILVPARKHHVEPNGVLSGFINIDATNIYGGVYDDKLSIQTNVPGMESLEKPVLLTVTGDAIFAAPDSVDFGHRIIAFEYGAPSANYVDLNFENTGSAPMEITWAQMADGTKNLTLMMLTDGWWGPEWTPIEFIYSPWGWDPPTFRINPGDKLAVRAAFSPDTPGDFADELVLTTSLGEKRIIMVGVAIEPPSIHVDVTPIEVSMNSLTEEVERSIAFDNVNGKSPLEYELSIDYGRVSTSSNEEELSGGGSAAPASSGPIVVKPVARPSATYHRTINHSDKDTPETFVGTGGTAPFTLATKYNAGPDGFNLSHVETWFRPESVTSGTIHVEIRAGGSSIIDAQVLAEGSFDFTSNGNDGEGTWHTVRMERNAGIYPNEDFYVVVTYPLGIEYPQGTLMNEPTTPGRYYYFDLGLWYDLNELSDFKNAAWLMYAGEETAEDFGWLKIVSQKSGTLQPGESSAIGLAIQGPLAKRGDQIANVVIRSNDANNSRVTVPVKLHVNEAPLFVNVPESIVLSENEADTLRIGVTDPEGNTFTITRDPHENLSSMLESGLLTVILTPRYGDEGNYEYTFKATDEFGAESSMTLRVEVLHANRAPEFVGDRKDFEYHRATNLNEYDIRDYYSDPDGDAFTFEVRSLDESIANVYGSTSRFIVRTLAIGNTKLVFTLTDIHGAVKQDTVDVSVDVIAGLEEQESNFKLYVYPNPTSGKVAMHIGGEIRGAYTVTVRNTLGVALIKGDENRGGEIQLDLTSLPAGIYLIEVRDDNGKSVRRVVKE